jgi:hypothetical protein
MPTQRTHRRPWSYESRSRTVLQASRDTPPKPALGTLLIWVVGDCDITTTGGSFALEVALALKTSKAYRPRK